MTNRIDEIRAMVKRHGGMFHGPRVEHLSMPETSFFAMMKEIDEAQSWLLAEVDRLTAERDAMKAENAGFRFGLNVLTTTFYKDDQHQAYAKHILEASK